MAVDPKLRELLDSLDEAPARSRPADDRQMLLSVLERLKIRDSMRLRPRAMPRRDIGDSLQSELEAARAEAQRRQEELDRIVAERQQSDEALRAAHDERADLVRRQQELEARLADLEAANHGGHLSFVEEDDREPVAPQRPVVEFSRVDLDSLGMEDELMEFESISSHRTDAFGEPDHDAWTESGPSWEEGAVAWDDEDATTDADWSDDASWEQVHDDPDPYAKAPADAAQEHAWAEAEPAPADSWEQVHDDPSPWTDDTSEAPDRATDPAWEPAPTAPAEQLDERTQRDLNELERQLRDLEDELAKRQAVTGKKNTTDDAHD